MNSFHLRIESSYIGELENFLKALHLGGLLGNSFSDARDTLGILLKLIWLEHDSAMSLTLLIEGHRSWVEN